MLGTLKRAGDVLDLFTVEEPEWGVTATAQRLGIGKSLAHDVLTSLAAIGLVQRVGHGRYRLGWRNISLASVLLRTNELRAQSRPVLRDLVERQGIAVSLVAWDRRQIIYIDRRQNVRTCASPGPAAGTAVSIDGRAASKVLMASRPNDEIRALWGGGFVRTRHNSLDELELDLERIRLHGWAGDEPDEALAGSAVAAPVRDADGAVAAAISLDLSECCRITDVHMQAQVAVAAASRISNAIRDCVLH
ncbi:MAG: IclR family transcriptional regulator C-terminal domain-containing protein [Solirubrobacteraceae bacterium]